MIKIEVLEKRYKEFHLLIEGFSVNEGESVFLVGNNGSGKTTFLRVLLDLIKSKRREGHINNISISNDITWKNVTGSFLDNMFLIGFLSPIEYFTLIAKFRNWKEDQLLQLLKEHANFLYPINLKNDKKIRHLSSGNRIKVGIIGSLIGNLKLLILDEPWSNLDPSTCLKLIELLRIQKQKNIAMLISSHNLQYVYTVCDRIILMENGKIILDEKFNTHIHDKLEDYFKNN